MADTRNSCNKDFRKTKIYPIIDDINGKVVTELSPNLIDKSYEDGDHYFKTQFNLLREESVRPLVEAVDKLRPLLAEETQPKDDNQSRDKLPFQFRTIAAPKEDPKTKLRDNIEKEVQSNVYYDIRLVEPFVAFDMNYGPVLNFTFDYKPIEKIDLVDCQHLMTGGILCLSSDNFVNSIVLGIITKSQLRDRDPKTKERLWSFCLKLDFDNNKPKHFYEFLLRPRTIYVGVESPSYYEGFRHTLKRLQNMSENFPMSRYIVDTKKDIKPPKYLTEDTTYNMSYIKLQDNKKVEKLDEEDEGDLNEESDEEFYEESDEEPEEETDEELDEDLVTQLSPLLCVKLLENDPYGDKRAYNRGTDELKKCSTFDIKQFDAFYAALTKELCVIEGPPGTGKTFVGLKIVECLLNNSPMRSEVRPILIVCYKNHALDQFLEGIIKFNRNVVRIGGNCESEELKEYRLSELESKFREDLKEGKLRTRTEEDEDEDHMTNGIKLLDPKLIHEYQKYQKLVFRIRGIQKSVKKLTDKIEKSFENVLDSKHLVPYIKPQKLAKYFSNNSKSLYMWLNPEDDPKFTDICNKMLKKKRLSLEAFDDVPNLIKKNVLELEPKEKWLLYLYWREQLFKYTEKELKTAFKTIAEEINKMSPKRAKFQRMLCKGAQVIGLTVTGAAKYSELVEAFNPEIMIVEEAAEVLEGHVVAAISSNIQHLILIGDHKQLRPLTNVQKLTDEYNLDISLFERLVKNKLPFVQLELQHRMRPCISELLKVGGIYDNLRNGEKVKHYPTIEYTFNKNMYFLDHQNIEDNNMCRDVVDKSRSNLYEANLVLALVKYFLLRNYPEDKITVLATYNAQVALIRRQMFQQKDVFVRQVEKPEKPVPNGPNSEEPDEVLRVRVSTVDGFQGEENNIIIISFVRSSKRNSIGFLGNKNRVNVALSRAKHALYCIGNFTIMAREEETKMWAQIKEYLLQINCFGEEFTIGCKCTGERDISMPHQLELFNQQLKNGICKCLKQK